MTDRKNRLGARSSQMQPLMRWLAISGVALCIFGCKLWLINFAGSDLPVDDQWDAEGAVVLRPWVENWFGLRELIHPHNEHRPITTKLYVIALFVADGQWDALVQTVANAAVHSFVAILLLLVARKWLTEGWGLAFAGLLLLLFALPFAWENTLRGFQIQFYFLLLFSVAHIYLSLESNRFTGRWCLGQLAGALALASMASGFFSAVAVLVSLTYGWRFTRSFTAQQSITFGIAVLLVAVGWWSKTDAPLHSGLKAQSVEQFIRSALLLFSWPGVAIFPWSLLLATPVALFLARCVRQRQFTTDDTILLGVLSWVILQCIGSAYARGNADPLAPRYLDLLAVGSGLQFIFIVREFPVRSRRVVAFIWFVAFAGCLFQQSFEQWNRAIVPNAAQSRRRENNVRHFLRHGDTAALQNSPPSDLPYPNSTVLLKRLSAPSIQQIMPPSVRGSVPVTSQSTPAPKALPPELEAAPYPVAVSTWITAESAQTFTWRSSRQSATTLPVLRFRVAGDLGTDSPGLKFVVKSISGAVPLVPEKIAPGRWKTANVFRPDGEWWIEVTDADPSRWFAFTEPVEVGRWSWLAGKLLKGHLAFMLIGGCLLIVPIFYHRRNAAVQC